MEMVKAVVFPEAEKADITEVPLAEPGPADLVVDTLYSGISIGTEGWVFRAKYKDTKFPLIPGYMAVGTVSHVGEGVRDFREGEVVFVNTGVKYRDEVGPVISWGHHASRLVVPAEWGKVFKVPPDLDLRAVSRRGRRRGRDGIRPGCRGDFGGAIPARPPLPGRRGRAGRRPKGPRRSAR